MNLRQFARCLPFVFAFTIVALAISPIAAATSADNPLTAERWKTRPIVIVVPTADDALLQRVQQTLRKTTSREAFIDRDMVLYTVIAGEGRRDGKLLGPRRTRAMLQALDIPADGKPRFLLIGKDGGIKMTEGADVKLEAVFAEIDRMPMRQR
ncbi:DUF4174 domain-containing protein [Variovorax sp. RHLX14]|uniref:DUF4174 domain-containing protein n=1 Tax=Variovorax sp. RHLX14 TaxID=1259731 RepID=UPI003F476717